LREFIFYSLLRADPCYSCLREQSQDFIGTVCVASSSSSCQFIYLCAHFQLYTVHTIHIASVYFIHYRYPNNLVNVLNIYVLNFTLCSPCILTLIFSYFNQRMHFFLFLFNSPYICIGCDPAIIRGTLISSLHSSLVHLVLSQPLHCSRLLFTLGM
jgi:hypothetical protein